MSLTVRRATPEDLDALVELTRCRRRRLAQWEPTFWNPRSGSDDLHAWFLNHCLTQADIDAVVVSEGDHIVGCAFIRMQQRQWFLDDLCVVDDRWEDLGAPLVSALVASPLITCCPRKDLAESSWLAATGAERVTEYHVLDLRRVAQLVEIPADSNEAEQRGASRAVHTFAGGRLDPAAVGALVIDTDDASVIGSTPIVAPIFDPGGPTAVIESISGSNLMVALRAAIATSTASGVAQLLVVVGNDDHQLRHVMHAAGATVPVDVWRLSPRRSQAPVPEPRASET